MGFEGCQRREKAQTYPRNLAILVLGRDKETWMESVIVLETRSNAY